MTAGQDRTDGHDIAGQREGSVEMPRPTVAPMVLALGIVLAAAGVATNFAFLAVGGVLFVIALGMWIGQLLSGRGHIHEPLVESSLRPVAVAPRPEGVERLRQGMPGYRLRLPVEVHPVSAGVKGGVIGGLVMPLPAMLYGLVSGHGIWMALNLLAGMVLPGIGELTDDELGHFNLTLSIIGIAIHVTVSLVFGLLYGVLLPTLPSVAKPVAWGALLMPLLWTATSFVLISNVNPVVRERIDWPWFIASQFVFGVVAAAVVMRSNDANHAAAGVRGGVAAGLLMTIPAILWGLLSGHGVWYPINLLSSMVLPQADELSVAQLEQFQPQWLLAASALHVVVSLGFGLVYGLLLPKLPPIPGPLVWGGLAMPMLWTATSYGLMGVVNPVLQQRVDWPWFILSQFVFGVVAAIVVLRSELIHIPPAGPGPDRVHDFAKG